MASQGTEVVCSNNSFANEGGDATLETVQERGNRMYLHRWKNCLNQNAVREQQLARSTANSYLPADHCSVFKFISMASSGSNIFVWRWRCSDMSFRPYFPGWICVIGIEMKEGRVFKHIFPPCNKPPLPFQGSLSKCSLSKIRTSGGYCRRKCLCNCTSNIFQRWGSWDVCIDFGAHWPAKGGCLYNLDKSYKVLI